MNGKPAPVNNGDRFWTIPNILSMIRIVMILPIVDQLKNKTPESFFVAFLLITIAYFTDFLDGFLARIMKSSSKFGQILDPLGDKLLAVTVSAVLYFGKQAPFYFFIMILLRDLTISMGAIYAMNTHKTIVLPMLIGKITTIALGIVLSYYPLSYSFVMKSVPYSGLIRDIATIIASVLLVISGLLYYAYYIRNFIMQKREKVKTKR
jgi:CDP-diacylglycerol--glycerol-3-phosphate 3-phosphatidyltransferase